MGSGFCPTCGSILPLPCARSNNVYCYCCETEHNLDVFKDMKADFTITFNSIDILKDKIDRNSKNQADGPIVKRKCPMCGNNKMSYATLQLRSADEGQTVFYTCIKCKYKETENS